MRLQNASLPEVINRIGDFLFIFRTRARFKKSKIFISDSLIPSADVDHLQLPEFRYPGNDSRLQSLLSGETFTLNGNKREIIAFEDRTRGRFSCDIPVSQNSIDIRMVWEPARLQHLTILLLYLRDHNYQSDSGDFRETAKDFLTPHPTPLPSGEERKRKDESLCRGEGRKNDKSLSNGYKTDSFMQNIGEFVRNSLLDWLDKNPFLSGPHYFSAMECGLRIPVFFYALKILDNLDDLERQRILTSIYQHAWWISRRLSLYSSLGNHTVCECIGLVFAGAVFRSAPEGIAWLNRGIELLQQELFHQILEDGGPAEQSLNYHRFVLDLYWLAADFLEKNRLYDCPAWKPRLLQGETFLQAFCDDQGNFPTLGDSDDGWAIAPGIRPLRGSPFCIKLQKIQPPIQANSEAIKNQVSWETLPSSGYTIIRDKSGLILTFDHGPLGMAPLYGHGHADALSINLRVNGRTILVDPGTYRYNGFPEFRRYFKGTRAHNTVAIDGQDQAAQQTGFIWSHPFRAHLVRTCPIDKGLIIEGSHNGYERLKDPVTHSRIVSFLEGRHLLIRDTFSGTGTHFFELNFHLHPEAIIGAEKEWWVIQYGEARVFMRLFSGGSFTLIKGQEIPPLGWFSPAYGTKLKSRVLNCTLSGSVRNIQFLTAICIDSPGEDDFLLEMANLL
ncbi:Heparinase II/III family protein [Desulfobacca acetoxidans DSM 11109]|uniref:Heparinase II/III family protein n=2 Tax=Desulfobacca acetoxidans TaxID=60893 RepID=F2NDG8_DESAR|nr:Heparinase II/III family protein [Desulfobacca acetoxidans DSM 11109]